MNRALAVMLFAMFTADSGFLFSESMGGDMLMNGMDARAVGMGNAAVAVCEDVNSLYWNPSGLPFAKKFEASSMYSNLFNMNVHYATFGIASGGLGVDALKDHAVGLGALFLGIDDIPVAKELDSVTGEPKIEAESAKDREFALMLSYGYRILRNLLVGPVELDLSAGITGKYFGQTLYTNTAYGFNGDGGIKFRVASVTTESGKKKGLYWGEFNLGLVAVNAIPSKIKWDTASGNEDAFPAVYKTGLAYIYRFPWADEKERNNVTIAVEPEFQKNRQVYMRYGTEVWFSNTFKTSLVFFGLRAGFESGNFSVGASTGFLNEVFDNTKLRYEITIDYAFLLNPINYSHRFSLLWKIL